MPRTIAVTLFALAIGLLSPAFPLLSTAAIAQTNPTSQKSEADRLFQQAVQQYRTNQFEVSLQSWQQALTIYRATKDRRSEGNTLGNLGMTYGDLGNYDKAIRYAEQSLEIAREIKNRVGEGNALGNLGNAYHLTGNYTKAIEYQEESLLIDRENKDREGEGRALSNAGLTYNALGNYPKAIVYYEQSLLIAREFKDRRGEGNTLGNLGITYSSLGNYPKAIEFQEKSLAIARELKDRMGEGQSLGSLGNAYFALGNYPKVIEYQEKSLAIKQEIKDRPGEGLSLGNLGNVYYVMGNYPKAIEYQKQGLVIARELKDRQGEGRSLANIGLTYASLSDYVKAAEYQKQGIAIAREIKDRNLEGLALNNLGKTLLDMNLLKEAESTLQAAISIQESLRTGLTDLNKVSIADTQKNSYANLQQVLIAQKQPEAALEIAERGRARAFIELLASRRQTQSNGEIQALAQAPRISQIRQVAQAQNATMVEYSLIGGKLLYIWVIKPKGEVVFRSVPIDPAQPLRKLVTNGRNEIGVRASIQIGSAISIAPVAPTEVIQANLRKLHQLLIEPIAQDLPTDPNQQVIFLPQGELFLVPFAALPNAQGQQLIEKHTLSTAPSIQTLEFTRALTQRSKKQGDVLIVGDPQMPKLAGKQLAPLPGARQEAIVIGQLLKTTPLLGEQATKPVVLKQMQSAKILHFATHGLLDTVQGDIPGAIALAPSGNDNGLLSASEIFDLKLNNADLVVLSACDTGRGDITGDGVIGLSRSFVAAGAPSVLVSLWAVDDGSTSELMAEFYRQLQSQPNKAQALRQAMLKIRKQKPSPFYWAAFTLIGEAK
jgi:CHAT domain-containing protein/tetratricopeptide (TPR) repeat protein